MLTNSKRIYSIVLFALLCGSTSTGQTINQVNSSSQPNQWNNMFGRINAKQATLWAGTIRGQQDRLYSGQQNNAPVAQDPYAQYQQIGPTKVVHVGPATVQMGNVPPKMTPPQYSVQSLDAEALAQLARSGAQTTASNVHLAASNLGLATNVGAANGSYGSAQLNAGRIAPQLPSPAKANLGFGKRAANELQTAMRQLNPFTPRDTRSQSPTIGAHQTVPQNRDLFSAPVTMPQQLGAPQAANSFAMQQPMIHQTSLSPLARTAAITNVSANPGRTSNSLFPPPPSLTMSVTAAATRPNFKSPPVIGTPLRVASNDGIGSLPSPNIIGESPFGPSIESVPAPAALPAPIEQMLPPQMHQQLPGQSNLPIEPAPQQLYQSPVHQSPLAPQPSHHLGHHSGQSQHSHSQHSYSQPSYSQPSQHAQSYPNVQVIAPKTYPDSFTQKYAQRDLNAFVTGSVNGFCPPTNSLTCQQVVPNCKPAAQRCGQQGCGNLCGCRPCSSPLWFQWESLLYYIDGYNTPTLLTRSPAGTPPVDIGVLGRGTTETLFGGNSIGDGLRYGGRLTGGMWLDKCRKIGIQGELFALTDGGDDDFRTRFGGNSIVARPFFNEATGQQDAEILNMPGVALGTFEANLSSRIYSAAPALRFNLKCCGNECDPCNPCASQTQSRLDFLAGYRYFHLGETLQLYERFEPDNGQFPAGTTYEFFDEYRTSNDFHGIEFGFDWTRQRGRWYSQLNATVALGEVTRTTDINGFSTVNVPNAVDAEFAGGFYSNAQEQGRTSDRSFAVLPQARIKLGYCITPSLRVFAGYDVLYLSEVVRPGSLVDASLDPADLLVDQPAARRLTRDLPDDDFWMQGVSFGALWNF